jgi:hypothetical protein
VAATRGASSRVGTVLDDVVSTLVTGLHDAFETRINALVSDLKTAIGAPTQTGNGPAPSPSLGYDARAAGAAGQPAQPRTPGPVPVDTYGSRVDTGSPASSPSFGGRAD